MSWPRCSDHQGRNVSHACTWNATRMLLRLNSWKGPPTQEDWRDTPWLCLQISWKKFYWQHTFSFRTWSEFKTLTTNFPQTPRCCLTSGEFGYWGRNINIFYVILSFWATPNSNAGSNRHSRRESDPAAWGLLRWGKGAGRLASDNRGHSIVDCKYPVGRRWCLLGTRPCRRSAHNWNLEIPRKIPS